MEKNQCQNRIQRPKINKYLLVSSKAQIFVALCNNSLKHKAKEVLGEHLHYTATQLMEILQRNLALQKKRTLLLQHGYNPEDIRVCPGKIRVYVVLWYTGTF